MDISAAAQGIIPPTDFDLFLTEIGLINLTPEARNKLVKQAQEILKYLIADKITDAIPDDQEDEFIKATDEAVKTDNRQALDNFLRQAIPDIDGLVEDALFELKDLLRQGFSNFSDKVAELDERFKIPTDINLDEAADKLNLPKEQSDQSTATSPQPSPLPATVNPFPPAPPVADLSPQPNESMPSSSSASTPPPLPITPSNNDDSVDVSQTDQAVSEELETIGRPTSDQS